MNVVIYTTPDCSFCLSAKDFLKNNKINFVEVDISADPQAAESVLEKTGQFGVPVLVISSGDGENLSEEVIIGFDEEKLRKTFSV